MSELARVRNARDLWVSRSHLVAAIVGAASLTVLAFASGFILGRAEPARDAAAPLAGTPPGEALVELLARVDASAASHGAVEALTFPEVLAGDAAPPSPPPPPPERVRSVMLHAQKSRGQGVYTLVVGRGPADVLQVEAALLLNRGLGAFVVPAPARDEVGADAVLTAPAPSVDPSGDHWLVVGWFAQASEAEAARPVVEAAGLGAAVEHLPASP